MEASAILQPVVALGLWTAVMMIWMYATRIPAIGNADIPDDQMGHPAGRYANAAIRGAAHCR